MLLDEWLKMEKDFGELGDVGLVQAKMPKKLKRQRPIMTDDGPGGYVKHFLAIPYVHACMLDDFTLFILSTFFVHLILSMNQIV